MKEREERLLPEMTNEDRRKMLYLEETGGLPTQIDRSRDLFFRFLLGCPSRLDLPGYALPGRPNRRRIEQAAEVIASAERPVFYLGGGLARAGVPAGLVRLSIGIEDVDDILADIEQALAQA